MTEGLVKPLLPLNFLDGGDSECSCRMRLATAIAAKNIGLIMVGLAPESVCRPSSSIIPPLNTNNVPVYSLSLPWTASTSAWATVGALFPQFDRFQGPLIANWGALLFGLQEFPDDDIYVQN